MKRQTLSSSLGSFCPWLRYLGLGVWLAWLFLAFSGTVWLSDIEIDGSNLSAMYVYSSFTSAIVLILAALFRRRFDALLNLRTGVMCGALIAMLGSLAVILAGPYYLAVPLLFLIGTCMMGIGSALLALKCGQLYGDLQPLRALLYALLSQLVMVFIFYFTVGNNFLFQPISGGPSLTGILALAFLPLLAAYLITIVPTSTLPSDDDSSEFDEMTTRRDTIRKLPLAFWKFIFAILVFTLAASVAQGYYTTLRLPSATLIDSTYVMTGRAIFALSFILLVIRFFKNIALNKLYLVCMVVIALAFVAMPLLKIESMLFTSFVGFSYSIFDFLVWCLLAFIVFDTRVSSTIIFGLGRGVFLIGSSVGWFLGMRVLHSLAGTGSETLFYVVLAILVLLSATLVFTEKDFDLLFKKPQEQGLDLEELFSTHNAELVKAESEQRHEGPWLVACRSLGEKSQMSSREQEILELLATGYGSEDIAERLSISINTVRTHTQNIYVKLDVHSRQELTSQIKLERNALDESAV